MTSKFRIVPEWTVSHRTVPRHRIEKWQSYHGDVEFTGTDGEWVVVDIRYSLQDAKNDIILMIQRETAREKWERDNPIVYYP